MKIYRERKALLPHLVGGVLLAYISIDSINTWYFRKLVVKYLKFGEFGTNAREEYLYYLLLFLGLLQLYVFFQNILLPIVEITDSHILFRANEKLFLIKKDRSSVQFIEVLKGGILHIKFSNESFTLDVSDVLISDLDNLIQLFN